MSDPAPPAAPLGPANIGPDGENIVEMTYCEPLPLYGLTLHLIIILCPQTRRLESVVVSPTPIPR